MAVQARFVGEDGSLGYRKGEEYELALYEFVDAPLHISRRDGKGHCDYQSLKAFLNNWTEVKLK